MSNEIEKLSPEEEAKRNTLRFILASAISLLLNRCADPAKNILKETENKETEKINNIKNNLLGKSVLGLEQFGEIRKVYPQYTVRDEKGDVYVGVDVLHGIYVNDKRKPFLIDYGSSGQILHVIQDIVPEEKIAGEKYIKVTATYPKPPYTQGFYYIKKDKPWITLKPELEPLK